MTTTRLPAVIRQHLEQVVREGYPYETCGLLIGTQDSTTRLVTRAPQARNLSEERAHDRYELDPRDFLAADRQARAEGLEVVGIWHSHPDHPARPSETDRQAAWADYSYLIVSVTREGIADMRCWRLAGTEFVEEEIRA